MIYSLITSLIIPFFTNYLLHSWSFHNLNSLSCTPSHMYIHSYVYSYISLCLSPLSYLCLSSNIPIPLHINTPKYRVSSSILIYPKITHYNAWNNHLQLTGYFPSYSSCSLFVLLFLESRPIVICASISRSLDLSFCLWVVSILHVLLCPFCLLHKSFLLCNSFLLCKCFLLCDSFLLRFS